jgi:uncharacterized protein YajQ (UPF0234 family)
VADSSFDIVSKVDRQELDNALNQTAKELVQRFDFKGTDSTIEWKGELGVELTASTEERVAAALDVFKDKLVKRQISLKSLTASDPRASGKEYKISCTFAAGISQEQAKKLGKIMWDHCGMARSKEGLESALQKLPALREEFNATVNVPGSADTLNQSLEQAGRVADFLEFGEVMCCDARDREESCGGHFRTEHQFFDTDPEVIAGKTQAGEAKRHDEHFSHVSAWQYNGNDQAPTLHKEPLVYEEVHVSIRSYA